MSQGNSPLTLNITQKQSGENLTGASKVTGSPLTTQKAERVLPTEPELLWEAADGLQVACRWPALYSSTERAVRGLQKAPSTLSILSNPFKFQVFNFENMAQNYLPGNCPFSAIGHCSSFPPFQFRQTWFLPEGYPWMYCQELQK